MQENLFILSIITIILLSRLLDFLMIVQYLERLNSSMSYLMTDNDLDVSFAARKIHE